MLGAKVVVGACRRHLRSERSTLLSSSSDSRSTPRRALRPARARLGECLVWPRTISASMHRLSSQVADSPDSVSHLELDPVLWSGVNQVNAVRALHGASELRRLRYRRAREPIHALALRVRHRRVSAHEERVSRKDVSYRILCSLMTTSSPERTFSTAV